MLFTTSLNRNFRFRAAYKYGKFFSARTVTIYFVKNKIKSKNHFGITVSTKLGKAVTRNKIRRRLKEIYRLNEERFVKGIDIVAVARQGIAEASYADIERDFLFAAKRLGILEKS